MSWALAVADDMSTSVTGTLLLQPSGEWALEVVFALREVWCSPFSAPLLN